MSAYAAYRLAIAVVAFGYVLVVVSWAWHRRNHPDPDPASIERNRQLMRELRRQQDADR